MDNFVTIFMCGDVMTGRGIDQVMSHPGDPKIYEGYLKSAKGYVDIAEKRNGAIQKPVSDSYIWGDAISQMKRMGTDVRIINLETSVTKSSDYWRGKGINYKMNPQNISCLNSADIDYCSLANNHVLDWGYTGLDETINTLRAANIKFSGAGKNNQEAKSPAIVDVGEKGRVAIFSYGLCTSGIPYDWRATTDRPGINLLEDLSTDSIRKVKDEVIKVKSKNVITVVSIHWGSNWGYEIPDEQISFAHALIDDAKVDVVHGHSSHHIKGIEVYKDKPIIYGCGDFINDYEGISGHEAYRGDLGMMYFIRIELSSLKLVEFIMIPTHIKNFKVSQPSREDALWLNKVINNQSERFGARTYFDGNNKQHLEWASSSE